MRVLIVRFGPYTHLATESDDVDRYGRPFIVCSCLRRGWGIGQIQRAHNGGDHERLPVDVLPQHTYDKWWHRIYEPAHDNRQDRRDSFSWNLWDMRMPGWMRRLAERGLCSYYGHMPSADGRTCYYCHRTRSGRRGGHWNPMPTLTDPFASVPRLPAAPGTYTGTFATVPLQDQRPAIGPAPDPTTCQRHQRRNCPVCAKRRRRT